MMAARWNWCEVVIVLMGLLFYGEREKIINDRDLAQKKNQHTFTIHNNW